MEREEGTSVERADVPAAERAKEAAAERVPQGAMEGAEGAAVEHAASVERADSVTERAQDAVERVEGGAAGQVEASVSSCGTVLGRPGSKIQWSIDANDRLTVKRHLYSSMLAKKWSSQRYTGALHATLNIGTSLSMGGFQELSQGRPVQFSSLADSLRVTGEASMMLGAYAMDKADPNFRFVAEYGFTNQFAELQVVSGGRAVQYIEPSDRAAVVGLLGVQVKHGSTQTDVGLAFKSNLATKAESAELRLAHTLDNGNRLRITADPDNGTVGFGCDLCI